MPKYVLTWNERTINAFYSEPIEADSAEDAWEILWNGEADFEIEDWNVIDAYDYKAEEVE